MDADFLVVGAGLTGATVARQLHNAGAKVVVVDRRHHVAGNAYDHYDEYGVLVHKYGPHYFRTSSERVFEFLSIFTRWIPGNYFVQAQVGTQLYDFPPNIHTIRAAAGGLDFDRVEAMQWIQLMSKGATEGDDCESRMVRQVGRKLYDMFFKGYTEKQWGIPASEVDGSVCGRIPIRFNSERSYVDAKYKVMPQLGYTHLVKNMLAGIPVLLGHDESGVKHKQLVWTGTIDSYFGHSLGELPYRSLLIDFNSYESSELMQPCAQINYPEMEPACTRSVEYRHVTGQYSKWTTLSTEYSCPHLIGENDPYYPIKNEKSRALHEAYKQLATQHPNVHFAGRCGSFAYLNMDQAVASALTMADHLVASGPR